MCIRDSIFSSNGAGKLPLDNFDDFQYYGNFELGTPAQKTTLITDTGSNQLWIPTTKPQCYNSSQSASANITTTPGSIQYGQGYVAGYMGTEMLSISSLGLSNLSMVTLFVNTEEEMGGQKACGLMGLSNDKSWKNFLEVAVTKSQLTDSQFGFRLKETNTKTYFYIGSSSFPSVTVTWFKVVRSNYWAISVESTIIDGKTFVQPTGMKEGVLDTGTSLVLMAQDAMDGLVKNSEISSKCQNQGNYYLCPCTGSYPTVQFKSEGHTMKVVSTDYMDPLGGGYCMLGFMGISPQEIPFVLLGDCFLRGYFYALDKANNKLGLNL
eukprot:TRINITY_DN0_c196_g1_i9.p1 TRINITY_DN0_c196_g1~~TRINITY_DN0_c196_g1_i9.p1  ORF type:complete len:323 (-),score=34.33 TRINITY_DN0_c196_g1_i9:58-1026(-)